MLPQTEAFKQGVAALNKAEIEADAVDQLVSDTLTGKQVAAESSLALPLVTLRFVMSQLAFYGLSDEARVSVFLSAPIETPYSPQVQMDARWVDAIARQWLEHGRTFVQKTRDKAVSTFCGSPADANECALMAQASVETCSGYAAERPPTVDDQAMEVEYELKQNEHAPLATISFPATRGVPSRTTVVLPMDPAYRLFQAIDSIQQAMDRVSLGNSA